MRSLKKSQINASPSIKLYGGNPSSKSPSTVVRRINLANTPVKTGKAKMLKSVTPKKTPSAVIDVKNSKKEPSTLKKRKAPPMVEISQVEEEMKIEQTDITLSDELSVEDGENDHRASAFNQIRHLETQGVGDRMSMMDDKSVVNFNNLGPDDFIGGVHDDKGHRMKYIAKKVESDTDALFCNLCDDEIDMPLGYFACALCKEDHCKACAMDRDKQGEHML